MTGSGKSRDSAKANWSNRIYERPEAPASAFCRCAQEDSSSRKNAPGVTSYEGTTAYTYDAGNRVTQAVDSAGGTITEAYDDLDRLTSETTAQGSISYGYDAAGRRTTMTVAGQPQVIYSYDNADRLTQITQGTSTVSFGYDNINRRTSLTLSNSVNISYLYDNDSRVTGINYNFGANALGNLTYSYDELGRRTLVGGSFARTGFPQTVTSSTYDGANELTNWNGTAISYDLNGNMLSDGTNAFTWNARNQVVSLNGRNLQYDAFGRRIQNSLGTAFLYDGANAAQELSGGTATANLLSGGIDEWFSRTDSSGAFTPLQDALGSTIALVDAIGNMNTQYSYDPFGNTTTAGTASANPSQYSGRENEGNGLYFLRARYYSSVGGRFINEDPLGFFGGDSDLYRYVWDSPTNVIDPLGETGIGVSGSAALEGGLVGVGAGTQGSVGLGGFIDTKNGKPSAGAFASGGAFAGGPGWGASAPSQPGNGNWALGAYAGGGGSIWVSNANNVCDLSGPFKTYSVNAAWGWRAATVQLSVGKNAAGQTIVVFNYGGPLPLVPVTGGGFGVSVSGYNTNTITTAGRGCGCK